MILSIVLHRFMRLMRGVASRDMLVVFTRKPKVEGHVSGYADTMHVHERVPLEVPMWLP